MLVVTPGKKLGAVEEVVDDGEDSEGLNVGNWRQEVDAVLEFSRENDSGSSKVMV